MSACAQVGRSPLWAAWPFAARVRLRGWHQDVCARDSFWGRGVLAGAAQGRRRGRRRAPAHLRKSGLVQRLPFSPKLYIRQYVGFVRDGVRYLYVNAVLVEKKSPLVGQLQKAFPSSCGDVNGSWGIQYDPKAKQFTGFSTK